MVCTGYRVSGTTDFPPGRGPTGKNFEIGVRNRARLSLGRVEAKTPRPPLSAGPETRRAAAPLIEPQPSPAHPCRPHRQGSFISRPGFARPILLATLRPLSDPP